ncbi:hypothetical protein KC19_VG287700 [Ceratodon purpureus]|uniref:Uncharacterized protein n=1 Tax=Ceratodon purpureus TaxID=3225 RepID=A0A8T0HVJ5_CERPU|nr:hypothetical protein KC19_VG287700 [Ceratodon purpureus]
MDASPALEAAMSATDADSPLDSLGLWCRVPVCAISIGVSGCNTFSAHIRTCPCRAQSMGLSSTHSVQKHASCRVCKYVTVVGEREDTE